MYNSSGYIYIYIISYNLCEVLVHDSKQLILLCKLNNIIYNKKVGSVGSISIWYK